MTEKDIMINERLMNEFGLESGFRRRIYDHETGEQYTIRGKEIVVPGAIPGKNAVEFDPINNTRMMNFFFGSYMNILSEQGILDGDVLSYSTIPSNVPGKIKAVVKINPYDGDMIREISSKPYNNETSCYADLVCRINGDNDVDMTEFDFDRRKQNQTQSTKNSKKTVKKKG